MGMVFLIVLPAVLACHILWVAPRRFGSGNFQKRWKFLFLKFQPAVWWWAPVILMRNLFLNLTTAVNVTGYSQMWWFLWVVALYLLGVCSIRPWRSSECNNIDVLANIIHMFAVVLGATCMNLSLLPDNAKIVWFMILFAIPMAACVLYGVCVIADRLRKRQMCIPDEELRDMADMFAKASDFEFLKGVATRMTHHEMNMLRRVYYLYQSEAPDSLNVKLRRLAQGSAVDEYQFDISLMMDMPLKPIASFHPKPGISVSARY